MWNFHPQTNSIQLDTISGRNIERPQITPTPLQQDVDRGMHDLDSTMNTWMTCPKEDWFNESIITVLSGQQDLPKHLLDMIQNMTRWHECDNLIRVITTYDGKNMDLADWLLQMKK